MLGIRIEGIRPTPASRGHVAFPRARSITDLAFSSSAVSVTSGMYPAHRDTRGFARFPHLASDRPRCALSRPGVKQIVCRGHSCRTSAPARHISSRPHQPTRVRLPGAMPVVNQGVPVPGREPGMGERPGPPPPGRQGSRCPAAEAGDRSAWCGGARPDCGCVGRCPGGQVATLPDIPAPAR